MVKILACNLVRKSLSSQKHVVRRKALCPFPFHKTQSKLSIARLPTLLPLPPYLVQQAKKDVFRGSDIICGLYVFLVIQGDALLDIQRLFHPAFRVLEFNNIATTRP